MGHIRKGILGGFSGKVGAVIGASWKRTMYMRSLPKKTSSQTLAQRTQRAKFALVINLLRPLNAVLRIGWKLYAKHQTPFNAATAYTLVNAIVGEFPNILIDYPKVMISKGSLPPMNYQKRTGQGGKTTIHWRNNSGVNDAHATDKLFFAVINPNRNEAITGANQAERAEEVAEIQMPNHWSGDNVHIYVAFAADNNKDVSDSIHLTAYVTGT